MSMCALLLAATAAITGPTDNPEDQFRGIWYLGLTEPAVKAFSEFGFNFVFYLKWGFDVKNERLTPDSTARRDRWLDLAEKYGFDVTEALGVLPYDPYLRKTFPQVRADGSTVAYTDMMDPEVKRIVGKLTELNAATIPRDRPRFIGVMPASEVHDPAFPVSKPHLAEAWAAYSGGKPLPDHRNSKTSAHYTKLKDFPASRVIPDDRADFAFYKWFWKHGDGWNDYFTETAHAFDRAAGRRLMTFHDPAIRVPPIWGSGGDVAYLNQWTYIYPEPFNVSFVTACTEAMARGNPGQRVIQMAQAISYRSQLAPIGMKPADGPEPEWVSREPDAVYITTPPDLMQEAIWTLYSHKIDGILFHGWDSIVDATKYGEKKSGYRYTCDGLQATISNLFTGVGRELGPLFKALPESGRKIALLESASAWIFAKRGEGGYASGKYSSVALAATLGGLMPYVLYEEEIARDGIPAETEVLLMPFCDVLTETTAQAIRQFQKRGGVVLADENVAPDILPDGPLAPFDRAKKAAVDEPVLQKAAQKLKADVKRFTTLDAETESPDILVRLRRMKSADYLFAVNDRRGPGDYVGAWGLVWEKGLPNRGRVSVRRAAGAVYDLAKHAAVPFEVKDGRTFIDVAYETNDGRCLLVADKPLAPLEVVTQSGEVYVRTDDAGLMVPIRVEVKGRKPLYGVIRNGTWVRGFDSIEDVRVTNLADGKTYCAGGDKLQEAIDRKRAEEEAALKLAIPPDRETYLFKTMTHAFPKLRKVGAVSPYGECSPFVFKGRLMRMELADPSRGRDAKNGAIAAVIRDVETGKVVGRTGEGCYYQSSYVEGDTVYITATKRVPGRNATCGDTILLFESKDLVNWTSRELLSRPGWNFYNSTMTKGPDGYVIALESDNLKHARRYFTMFFATSKDMKEWTFLPDEKAYPKQRYCGGPFLKYVDGWYYLSLVTEMPCERWCTYLFRTKDFSEWECGRYNPMLMWDDDDRRVSEKAAGITPEFAERIRTGFVCNASDVEFCEFGGRTCIDYLVGDQRGFYYMAEAWYDGPLKEYLERQFE